MDELLARLRALSRRNSKVKASTIIINENLIIDQKAKSVRVNEKLIKLSPTEYRILEFLAINRGESKSHLEIYESVWGSQNSDILTSDTLKVHIASLRKKIGKDVIKTVREQGYMIEG
jgi:DNA-binding response OmpR family regulator